MTWTAFMDMHSGGGLKEPPYEYIYIEAPEDTARVIFFNRFGHNPERVSCTCCGEDYSIDSHLTLKRATAYQRGCASLETPRNEQGLYEKPDDEWWNEHYYVEPEEEEEAERRGWTVDRRWRSYRSYQTLDQYLKGKEILVIREDEITEDECRGDVPEQGFVWRG